MIESVLDKFKLYKFVLLEVLAIIIFAISFIFIQHIKLDLMQIYTIALMLMLFLTVFLLDKAIVEIIFNTEKDILEKVSKSYLPVLLILLYPLKQLLHYSLFSSLLLFIIFISILSIKYYFFSSVLIQKLKESFDIKMLLVFFLIGLLIKLVIMPFFYNGDFIVIHRAIHYVIDNPTLNLYPVIVHEQGNLWYNFTYYPLTYIILAFFYGMTRFLLPGGTLPYDFHLLSNAPAYVFFGKIGYLFFDILIALLLLFYFKDKKKSFMLFILWWLNPIILYCTYLFGQIDIILVFFIVTSIFLLKQNIKAASLALGLGAITKNFPLIFIPGFFINILKKPIKTMGYILISLIPFVLCLVPFLKNVNFRHDVLFNPSLGARIFEPVIELFQDKIFLFILFYIILFLFVYMKNKQDVPDNFNKYFLIFIMLTSFLFFALLRYSVHYTMWILPFVLIVLTDNNLVELIIPYALFLFIFLAKWGGFTTTWILSGIFNFWYVYK